MSAIDKEGKHCADDDGEPEECRRWTTTAVRLAGDGVGQRARGRLRRGLEAGRGFHASSQLRSSSQH